MPINPSIALGVNPLQLQMPDPNQGMNALARAMQIKNSMAEGDMNTLKMQELQRGVTENNALNALWSGAVGPDGAIDRNKLYSGMATGNLGSKIPGVQKQFLEADEARGKVQEQARKGYTFFQQRLGSHFADPNATPQSVAADLQGMVQAGAIDPGVAQKLTASIPQDPAQLRPFLRQILTSQMTPEQMLTIFAPKPEKIDNGQQISYRDTNPNSPTYGQATGGAPVQKLQTPDSVASVGAQMENARATRDAAKINAEATRDAASIKDKRDTEMKLADDYRNQSKSFKEVADAHAQLTATLGNATKSPAATLAGATKFMKMIDPGSVVRESELGMALNAQGVFDRAANYINILKNGKVLTPEQAKDFGDTATRIYAAAAQQQQAIDASYRNQAKTYGLRADVIVQDLGQNPKKPNADQPGGKARQVARTGTAQDGRKVIQYADGTIEYAN